MTQTTHARTPQVAAEVFDALAQVAERSPGARMVVMPDSEANDVISSGRSGPRYLLESPGADEPRGAPVFSGRSAGMRINVRTISLQWTSRPQ